MSNVPYCRADEHGRIVEYGSLSPYTFLHKIDKDYVYDSVGASPEMHYVADGMVRERPYMLVQQSGHLLSGLPDPCTVTINGKAYNVTGGNVQLDFPQSGLYIVKLEAWPWRDIQLEFTVPGGANEEDNSR